MNRAIVVALVVAVAGCGNPGVTQQSGAAACLAASACGILVGGVSACTQVIAFVNDPAVAASAHVSAAEINCIASAGHDCAAAKRCLGNNAMPASCNGNSDACNGNLWQSCTNAAGAGGNKGVQIFDCASVGRTCVANNGAVDCGFGTCSGGMSSCVGPDGSANGNLVQRCTNGILQREDCTRTNATCNPSGIFGAHCRGNGPGCMSPSLTNNTLRCEGAVLVSCADGQESRYDCGQLNLGCFPNPNGTGFGCFGGNACDPNNFTASCSGTKLTFCNKGQVQTADCAGAGFAACSPNGGGSCSN